MNSSCLTRYLEALKNYFNLSEPQVCWVVAINIVGLVLIIVLLYFRSRKTTRINNICNTNSLAMLQDLHRATFENDVISSIRLIQKYPQGINQPHPIDGYTPFMRASLHGNTQLVNIMLSFGADPSLRSTKGETPFYLATFYLVQNPCVKDASCIRTLFYAGSDINAINEKGYTPLHLASMFGHTNLVRWLLSKGASPVVQPFPYILARLQGHYGTAMLLKNRGLPAIEQK